MVDLTKARRERIRWIAILTLNNARPLGCNENMVLSVVQAEHPDATQLEMRRALDYLSDRELIELDKKPDGRWFAKLNRVGVDLADYNIDCEPGIARPEKYWGV